MGNDNGPSFLDLPRELRDMTYVYVCDGMRHDGSGWRKKGEYAGDCYIPDDCIILGWQPIIFQNCNIMRTCRQVHWEFAKVLYTRPFTAYRCHISYRVSYRCSRIAYYPIVSNIRASRREAGVHS
jgi:hypothetical protein